MTCHRLARLVGQGPTLIDALVGMVVDGLAFDGERAFLQYAVPEPESDGFAYARDLEQLPSFLRSAEEDRFGRAFLSSRRCIVGCARSENAASHQRNCWHGLGGDSPISKMGKVLTWMRSSPSTGISCCCESVTLWYDRVVAAHRLPLRSPTA